MKLTDAQLETYRRDGFVAVPGFLSREEAAAALAGIHRLFSPPYDAWLAAGKKNPIAGPQWLFPWDDAALNHAMTHPDLIDAAERITGTADLRLCEAHLGMKYAGGGDGEGWHIDYGNNTLGPELTDPAQMARHPIFFCYFTDVGPGDAPIRMLAHGRTSYDDAVPITGPAGTVCVYSLYTRHTATHFRKPAGERAVAWVAMYDARHTFNFPRLFTYKSGADEKAMARFIREASPRQLGLLGFPPPGDPLWTPEYVAGMEKRYPGFRGELYRRG